MAVTLDPNGIALHYLLLGIIVALPLPLFILLGRRDDRRYRTQREQELAAEAAARRAMYPIDADLEN